MKNELVQSRKENVFCDSRIVAKKFGKQHKNILGRLDKLRADLNILDAEKSATKKGMPTEVFTEKTHFYRGQSFRYFEMNRPAFSLFVMGFTGKKALEWKRKFNDAFYQMEQALLQQSNLEWRQEREQGKQIRIELTDKIKVFVDYASGQGSLNAEKYYILITKMQYKALGLIEKNEKVDKQFRNTLNMMDLHNLLSAEKVARKALDDGVTQKMHYKDIFQMAKKNVLQLADIMLMVPIKKIKEGLE